VNVNVLKNHCSLPDRHVKLPILNSSKRFLLEPTNALLQILRLGDRASYINKYRYQLDAANDLLAFNKISTCFGRVYAHLQEFELPLHCLLFPILLYLLCPGAGW
jgi:hypothetical protein